MTQEQIKQTIAFHQASIRHLEQLVHEHEQFTPMTDEIEQLRAAGWRKGLAQGRLLWLSPDNIVYSDMHDAWLAMMRGAEAGPR